MAAAQLSRTAASRAVEDIGWRLVLGTLQASVPVSGLAEASRLAAAAAAAAGPDADQHLRMELRPDQLVLIVQTRAIGEVTADDVEVARSVTTALAGLGAQPRGATSEQAARPVQAVELAVDALDIPAVRPFWKAVLGYVDPPPSPGYDSWDAFDASLPAGQRGPVWACQDPDGSGRAGRRGRRVLPGPARWAGRAPPPRTGARAPREGG